MNTAKIYAQASGQVDRASELKDELQRKQVAGAEEQAARQISISNWLANPMTKDFFSNIQNNITELDNRARELALSYPTSNNHQEIILLLVKSATLRQIMESIK